MTESNLNYVGQYPSIYELAKRGELVYRPEPSGQEEWKTIPEIVEDGFADCEDLAAARAAELIAQGVPAKAAIVRSGFTKDGKKMFHGIVIDRDGTLEDPTKLLKIQEGVNMRGGMVPGYKFNRIGNKTLAAVSLPSLYRNRYGLPSGEGYTHFLGADEDPAKAFIKALVAASSSESKQAAGTGVKSLDTFFPGLLSKGTSTDLLKALLKSGQLVTPQGNKKAALLLTKEGDQKKALEKLLSQTTPQERKNIAAALQTGNKDQAISKLLTSGALSSNPYAAAAVVALNILKDPAKQRALSRAFNSGARAARSFLKMLF